MRLFCLIAAALFIAACTPPVSRQSLGLVDPGITFAALRQDPDRHIGRYMLLGGAIVAVRPMASGSELEVMQLPTDDRGRITETRTSAGRFIIRDETFRDPALYEGRLVTVVGKVEGKKTAKLGEIDYLYPVLSAQELHLWSPGERSGGSPFHLGIGVGFGRTVIH